MLIKNILIGFLVFFSFSLCAKNIWTVNNIEFKGLKNFSKNEALKNIFFHVGDKISENEIRNSIKSLFKTGNFDNIKIIYLRKKIIFKVQERPIISNIIFSGNNIINNSTLEEYLNKLNIRKGSIFNPFLVNIFIKTIKNFYDNIGRYESNIKILKNFSKNNNIILRIVINEGVSKKINNIKIFGIKSFSQEKITSLFRLKDYHSWWNIFDKHIYSPQELNKDLDRLKNFYLNQGYFYFDVNNQIIDDFKNKNNVNIIINISEGKKYKISNFFINGNLFSYRKAITEIVNINRNEIYNQKKINTIINKIQRFLSEYGYINSKIIVNPQINHSENTVTLDFNIDIQTRFFVKRIYFSGNEITQDKVLRRLIKQMEGRYFNIKLIESGKDSLEKTKYFSKVEIIKSIVSNDSNQVNIIYKVKEKSTGSINFGLGYGVDSGVSFNTYFSQDNIFGSGNSLKSSIVKNSNQKYADISINYPYFISNGTDLNTRFFYNDFKYNLNNFSNIIKNTYGFESNLGFLINETNKVNFGFGYTHNGILNQESKINTSISNKKSLNDIQVKNSLVNDFTLNYSWIYDNLKYYYFPISGNQTYLSGKNTIPGSDNKFYKAIADTEEYVPLNKQKNFIFLSHIHMGIGDSFNEKKLPFYENFYASSMNKIRGFRMNTIGPKTIYNKNNLENCIEDKNNNSCESIDSIGGNAIFIANLELITPIPFINNTYSKFIRPSLFLDAGNIWNIKLSEIEKINWLHTIQNSSLNNIYASYGLSLQWFSPIGPLVFSYAFPIQKNNDHQLEPFQFNIGKSW